jgi:UDP-N-acetylmuramyl pentapeptide phosphotransferase/UDP-N-acetylglucosamine-1-phosphate transferase
MIFENLFLDLLCKILFLSILIIGSSYKIFSSNQFSRYFLDIPNNRSLHINAIPRIGGLCIFINIILLNLFFLGMDSEFFKNIIVSISLIFLISLLDDLYSLSFVTRIITHIFSAIVFSLLYFSTNNLFILFAAIFLIISSINFFNFIDGSDGFAAGIFSSALLFFVYFYFLANNYDLFIFTSICFFSSLVFLYFNFSPAKVFLGDSGSTILGFIFAILSIIGFYNFLFPFWFPIILIFPFLLDTSSTILKRIYKKNKFWLAHNEHYYQRLILMGMSHKKLSLLSCCYVLCSGTLGLTLNYYNDFRFTIITFVMLTIIFSILLFKVDQKWISSQTNE